MVLQVIPPKKTSKFVTSGVAIHNSFTAKVHKTKVRHHQKTSSHIKIIRKVIVATRSRSIIVVGSIISSLILRKEYNSIFLSFNRAKIKKINSNSSKITIKEKALSTYKF